MTLRRVDVRRGRASRCRACGREHRRGRVEEPELRDRRRGRLEVLERRGRWRRVPARFARVDVGIVQDAPRT
eukprot:1181907-Heterocapsa_arctica.AAC.1